MNLVLHKRLVLHFEMTKHSLMTEFMSDGTQYPAGSPLCLLMLWL